MPLLETAGASHRQRAVLPIGENGIFGADRMCGATRMFGAIRVFGLLAGLGRGIEAH